MIVLSYTNAKTLIGPWKYNFKYEFGDFECSKISCLSTVECLSVEIMKSASRVIMTLIFYICICSWVPMQPQFHPSGSVGWMGLIVLICMYVNSNFAQSLRHNNASLSYIRGYSSILFTQKQSTTCSSQYQQNISISSIMREQK